jgi:hypothetical protein
VMLNYWKLLVFQKINIYKMTANYIKSKIENKARTINNTSVLIIYCINTFSKYFTAQEICTIINDITKQKPRNVYKSPFSLGN